MSTKGKKIASIVGGIVVLGAAITLPIMAVSNASKHSTSFDYDKIGVYCDTALRPVYEEAVRVYNKKYPDRKYDIQLRELGAFDGVDLIQTLGYADQKVADLIYCPIDRIPSLVELHGALMGFDSPEAIISEEFDSKIYSSLEGGVKEFAAKGEALVVPPNSEEGTEPQPFYFGIPHCKEALVLYYKGFSDDEISSIEKITKIVNDDNWTNSMYSFKFNDLWYALGVVAGFIESKQEGAGQNGQLIGKILVSNNTLSSGYQSNMTNLVSENKNWPLQNYEDTPGWDDKGITIDPKIATEALQEALDFLASYYNRSKVYNNILRQEGNDWLLDGDNFAPKTTQLAGAAKKAAVIDGPWMVDQYRGKFDQAIPVPNLTESGVPYVQSPGGWLYGINQRNATNPEKIRDMKRFLNVLLTDENVIMQQYKKSGKIIEGQVAKKILDSYADNPSTDKLEATVIKSVNASVTMDKRPDGGNADFNLVWSRWDEQGFRSTSGNPGMKHVLVNPSVRWTDAQVSERLRQHLATSFETMLRGLKG